jgi:glycosyltransferase involved in cell wall biosynthesis
MRPEDVFVVRNAPESARFADAHADDRYRYGRKHMAAYVGIMAVQDGLDYLIDAAHVIIVEWQRQDIQFVLVGSGPEFARLRERVRVMNLEEYITFMGFIADAAALGSILATADVCVCPDPANPANNVSTMHKIMEYMALGKPIVQFDLHEGRVSAADASLYAASNDATDFAKAVVRLIDDPEMRDQLGRIGFQRITTDLSWEAQVPSLLAGYEHALLKQCEAGAAVRSGD